MQIVSSGSEGNKSERQPHRQQIQKTYRIEASDQSGEILPLNDDDHKSN